jgi:hypothetical protein
LALAISVTGLLLALKTGMLGIVAGGTAVGFVGALYAACQTPASPRLVSLWWCSASASLCRSSDLLHTERTFSACSA